MLIYPVRAETRGELKGMIDRIGADPRSMAWFEPKMNIHKIYAHGVDFRAAAFLKQELLARGGDVVVHRNVIDGRVNESDIMIMGTPGQLSALLSKMSAMDCWGLKELREVLREVLESIGIKNWEYALPRGRTLCLGGPCLIMGILNITPDSFYSVSRVGDEGGLISKAAKMLGDGADILDLGAESTRPGAIPVSAEDERERVIPFIKTLRREFPEAVISVDTMKPEIALDAAEAGADIINDVGNDTEMGDAALKTGLPLVVTHCEPLEPECPDIVGGVMVNLSERLKTLKEKGVKNLIVDPGVGFEKDVNDNMKLLKSIGSFRSFGLPILVGHSRKKFLDMEDNGKKLAPEPEDRLAGTLAVSALLASSMARVEIIRVHDVLENARAVWTAQLL
ncbi:MAG: dihydropteroate synthase [Synergistaceae bacterium]|nr:dihydropteroate synthase [Synergistaceae bacterium]